MSGPENPALILADPERGEPARSLHPRSSGQAGEVQIFLAVLPMLPSLRPKRNCFEQEAPHT